MILVATLFTSPTVADTPIIDVIGIRPEHVDSEHPGQGEIIRPTESSRFDTKTQLQQNSALAIPETGRITASGFAVPRIRGQDTRLTEVYVEDLLLQDPFSGLPLVDELDLRAFGELALYQGVTPAALATINPIGAMQYRIVPAKNRRITFGDTFGRPYGNALWLLGEVASHAPTQRVTARIYTRQHRTDGRFRYYDDGATPYNTADDTYRFRLNNDRLSQTAMPSAAYDDGTNKVSALVLWQQARAGLPSNSSQQLSQARTTAQSRLAAIDFQRQIQANGSFFAAAPDALKLGLSASDDARTSRDPDLLFDDRSEQSLSVRARRGALRATWQRPAWTFSAESSTTHAAVSANDTPLARVATTTYTGLSIRPIPSLLIESKWALRAHTDRKPAATSNALVLGGRTYTDRQTKARGGSLAAAVDLGPWRPYVQWGRAERLPSLLEEWGDGARVRPAPGLAPERAHHIEGGVSTFFLNLAGRAGIAAFEDRTDDRITLLPAIGQSLRAQNIGRTRVRGGTINSELFIDTMHPSMSLTLLEPLDQTATDHPRQIPGVPQRQVTLSWEQRLGALVARWTSHERSRLFRDTRNEIEIPGYWLHDLSLDAPATIGGAPIKLGLTVINVADATHAAVGVRGDGTTQGGESGLADVAGYPLPGRQWRISIDGAF